MSKRKEIRESVSSKQLKINNNKKNNKKNLNKIINELTGTGIAIEFEKEKLVGSLMFLRNGHLKMSWSNSEDPPFMLPNKKFILEM